MVYIRVIACSRKNDSSYQLTKSSVSITLLYISSIISVEAKGSSASIFVGVACALAATVSLGRKLLGIWRGLVNDAQKKKKKKKVEIYTSKAHGF